MIIPVTPMSSHPIREARKVLPASVEQPMASGHPVPPAALTFPVETHEQAPLIRVDVTKPGFLVIASQAPGEALLHTPSQVHLFFSKKFLVSSVFFSWEWGSCI